MGSRLAALGFCLLLFSGWTSAQTAQGDLRLVGGTDSTHGRVEIFINGTWGTVCDDRWDLLDATVVCRQLNLPTTRVVFTLHYGFGSGSILLDDVGCRGDEARLLDCPTQSRAHNCGHREDIGVACSGTNGDIRLVGGTSEREGRVEIRVGGEWGTVCDDSWDEEDADVVCRQLGFNNTVGVAAHEARFGEGTGQIWLDDVECSGGEDLLIYCEHDLVGTSNCVHNEDAGVICIPMDGEDIPTGSIRLVGGSSEYEGRVEVFLEGVWGTVCDDAWDDVDAAVVCSQLNFITSRPQALSNAQFGEGIGLILLDEVRCRGEEARLVDCPHGGVGNHDCSPEEDAGVICIPDAVNGCLDGDARLVNGNTSSEGRVEVCLHRTWGTVCDHLWTRREARVVCRQLMLPYTNATVLGGAFFGEGSSLLINLDNVMCSGSEDSIIDCYFREDTDCDHDADVGVRCLEAGPLPPGVAIGDVRLVNGRTPLEGRVEVFGDYRVWGTVCDDRWDDTAAVVVCRQLGLPTQGAEALPRAFFGPGEASQLILLDDVRCDGEETRLLDCDYPGETINNCHHEEDASVRCMPPPAPGPPVNIEFSSASMDCSEVTISWDPPVGYQYLTLIRYYTIFITTSQREGFTITQTSNTTTTVIRDLPCDLSYVCFVSAFATESGTMSSAMIFWTTLPQTTVLDATIHKTAPIVTSGSTESAAAAKSVPVIWVAVFPVTVIVVVLLLLSIIIFTVVFFKKKRTMVYDVEGTNNTVHVTANKFIGDGNGYLATNGNQLVNNPVDRANSL